MQDAFNLAWKLALVCRGICAEEPLLDSYNTERSPIGDRVLQRTQAASRRWASRADKPRMRSAARSRRFLFGVEPALQATTRGVRRGCC